MLKKNRKNTRNLKKDLSHDRIVNKKPPEGGFSGRSVAKWLRLRQLIPVKG
jgi:hypothetical protein